MKLHQKLRRTTVAAAASLAFAFCAGNALAQPAGMHGPHGGGSPDDMIGHLIAHAKTQLSLNTSQQGMFDSAVASSKAARESGRALHQTVHDTLAAELAKPEPDLTAVAAAADNAQAQGQALRKTVRGQWLALYATFTPDQKAVVKTMLQNHMAKADSFRQKMMNHMRGGTTG
jgi:Spy/CpxP family protein refolding chaperone